MPYFFFHYTSGGTTIVDDVGVEFSSLEEAYLDVCETVLAIAFEKLRARRDPKSDAFDIVSDEQNVLMHVPFSEVLRPEATTNVSIRDRQTALAFESCERQAARGKRLENEIRAEFARTKKVFGDIRENLASFQSPFSRTDRL